MITPTQRARVVIRHAYLAGSGEPITRADVLATLAGSDPITPGPTPITSGPVDPDPTPDGGSTSTQPEVDPGVDPTRGSDPDPTRITPDPAPITPDQAPDEVVSLADAATRLDVSVATVKRYAAPSSGRLTRQGDGVTRASLEALAGTR